MSTTSAPTHARTSRTAQKIHVKRKVRVAKAPALPMPAVLLDAKSSPDVVTIPARSALAFDGAGPPESEAFQQAIGALYGIGYTLKFARKRSGGTEFKIGPLEGRWWAALEGTEFVLAPRQSWRWRLRMAMPDDVTDAEVAETIRAATSKKGSKLENSPHARRVFLERIPPQRVGRALHVGPYADEGRTLQAIGDAMTQAAVEPAYTHVEIYLSDPRRTPPARLKTVLLRETRA